MDNSYIDYSKQSKRLRIRGKQTQQLINDALHLLACLGLPFKDRTSRALERTALTILTLTDVKTRGGWANAKDLADGRKLTTREIVRHRRKTFGEDISDGSYDDVRRADLERVYLAGLVQTDDPTKDQNDGTRRYGLNPEFSGIVRAFGNPGWEADASAFVQERGSLALRLSQPRILPKTEIALPSGEMLAFLGGAHNKLQKAIIEEFLPRFGKGAEVLYVGEPAKKYSYFNKSGLQALKFFDIEQSKLPDVIAYSTEQNWIFLIEAVYTSGPISAERRMVLCELLKDCSARAVYVTAFPDRATFRRFAPDIAWETEVWIACDPDHMIHFDGEKFLGPYEALK